MIDCESEVYTRVADAVREKFPEINIASEYVAEPASFPHVSIELYDSYPHPGTADSSGIEKITSVAFSVNVYSNKRTGKKGEAKSIMALIDTTLNDMNFTRMSYTPVPNMQNATIYRLTATYSGTTDGQNFYRR